MAVIMSGMILAGILAGIAGSSLSLASADLVTVSYVLNELTAPDRAAVWMASTAEATSAVLTAIFRRILGTKPTSILPPRYRDKTVVVSAAPMGAAALLVIFLSLE